MRFAALWLVIPTVALAASFEVATIKPAVGVAGARVVGGPKWIDENSYDILAKASYPAAERELIAMVPQLLADRFQLVVHRETRQMAGYVLTVAKGGVKAAAADPSRTSGSDGGRGRIDSYASPLSQLCIRLTGLLGRPVVDETGDTRKFDFHLRWAPDDAGASDAPSLFLALQEQLGLKLESRRVDAEVVVVDHVESPSAN